MLLAAARAPISVRLSVFGPTRGWRLREVTACQPLPDTVACSPPPALLRRRLLPPSLLPVTAAASPSRPATSSARASITYRPQTHAAFPPSPCTRALPPAHKSFPLCTARTPRLCAAGAFSAAERYSPKDVTALVEFARLRGVRVLAELDVPAHAGSWCRGHPEVCPSAACAEPLSPASGATSPLLAALLDELVGRPAARLAPADESARRPDSRAAARAAHRSGLFTERLLHLGGDEVDTACWARSAAIVAWLRARNLTLAGGYAELALRAHALAAARGATVVGWDEIFEAFGGRLGRSTIVQVWRSWSSASSLANVTAAGLRALASPDPTWYLDSLATGWAAQYSFEPCAGISDGQCALVLGGGGAMWGETADGSNVEQTVWPRLAAIAEKLWSARALTAARGSLAAAEPRLRAFRCRLLARGIAAAPVGNAEARGAPAGPGGCAEQ